MRHDRTLLRQLEILTALILTGLAATAVAGEGRLPMLLDLYRVREEFAGLMAIAAFLVLAGLVVPCRAMRHAGLWLTAFVLFPAFALLLENNMAAPAALGLPVLALAALVLLIVDCLGKPRHEKVDR